MTIIKGNKISGGLLTSVPAFSAIFAARGGSATSPTSPNAYNKLVCTIEDFDTHGWYEASNGRFTPQIAGLYRFSMGVQILNGNAVGTVLACFYKNGVQYARGGQRAIPAGDNWLPTVTKLIPLNGTTDYVEAYFYGGAGTGTAIYTGGDQCYFDGELVKADA